MGIKGDVLKAMKEEFGEFTNLREVVQITKEDWEKGMANIKVVSTKEGDAGNVRELKAIEKGQVGCYGEGPVSHWGFLEASLVEQLVRHRGRWQRPRTTTAASCPT